MVRGQLCRLCVVKCISFSLTPITRSTSGCRSIVRLLDIERESSATVCLVCCLTFCRSQFCTISPNAVSVYVSDRENIVRCLVFMLFAWHLAGVLFANLNDIFEALCLGGSIQMEK